MVILRKFDEIFIYQSCSNSRWSEGVHAESYQEQRNGSQESPYPPSLHPFLVEVSAMQELNRVITLYRSGKIGLFEAANVLDMHPSEFTSLMVEQSRNDVNPIPLMIRQ